MCTLSESRIKRGSEEAGNGIRRGWVYQPDGRGNRAPTIVVRNSIVSRYKSRPTGLLILTLPLEVNYAIRGIASVNLPQIAM